ncbi:hypothetical protein DSECCO2_543230 [anaerobic digester metagenome]
MGACHDDGIVLVIPGYHLPAIENPDPVTVLVLHADVAGVEVELTAEVLLKLRKGTFKILRFGQPLEGLDGDRLEFFFRVAKQGRPVVVDLDRSGYNIPLPGAQIRALDNRGEPVAGRAKLTLVAFLLAAVAVQTNYRPTACKEGDEYDHYRTEEGDKLIEIIPIIYFLLPDCQQFIFAFLDLVEDCFQLLGDGF